MLVIYPFSTTDEQQALKNAGGLPSEDYKSMTFLSCPTGDAKSLVQKVNDLSSHGSVWRSTG
jgi:hypothetical protein